MKQFKHFKVIRIAFFVIMIALPYDKTSACGENMIHLYAVRSSPLLNGAPGVDIEVTSQRLFPAINTIPVLSIGNHSFYLSRYKDGSLNTLIFTLTLQEVEKTRERDVVVVKYEPDSQGHWNFGLFLKRPIERRSNL